MELYRNFEIHPATFEIYKDGKPVFTAFSQRRSSIEQARTTIDASIMTKELLDKFPNKQAALKKLVTECELENGTEERERFSDWMDREAEKESKSVSDY